MNQRQGSKNVKQQILDEFCETTSYCRGYARYWLRGKRVIVGDARQLQQRLYD